MAYRLIALERVSILSRGQFQFPAEYDNDTRPAGASGHSNSARGRRPHELSTVASFIAAQRASKFRDDRLRVFTQAFQPA
jgi:hypothetical protein